MVNSNNLKLSSLIPADDLPFEESLIHHQTDLKLWLRYLAFKHETIIHSDTPNNLRPLFILYERAVKILPGSYKLWKAYLDIRTNYVLEFEMENEEQVFKLNFCFERALFLLNKMPRIWLDYIQFLLLQDGITKVRRVFDRCLRSLPITQHSRIWKFYLKLAKKIGGELAVRIYQRYIKFEVEKVEDYIQVLLKQKKYDEATYQLSRMIDLDLPSSYGKTPYQLWTELSELICEHAMEVKKLKVEQILRTGIYRFTDQVGKLWCSLGQYWIKLGKFDLARDTYEEGISKVVTVRDFTHIFDTYSQFEETLLSSLMESNNVNESQLDLALLRFEKLMDRRPFLLNEVLLRQNPHNVPEWIKRVDLHGDDDVKAVETFTEAIKTIHPKKATTDMLPSLWVAFSRFYEDRDDLIQARNIFDKAVQVQFKTVQELSELWIKYAELEIRYDNYQLALKVLARATQPPIKYKNISYHDDSLSVQQRIFKSTSLWSFYVDLQESIGTLEQTKQVYNQILDLKIATAQIVINYANYLEENNYFEDSFKVYERGLELFNYPIAFEIWNIYLTKFLKRYGGKKVERTRDLFEQAVEHCPAKYCKPLYLLYGKFEEDYGLAKHAMRIYDRATRAVGKGDQFEMFQYYIAKASTAFGPLATREIYERGIEVLPDLRVKQLCQEFAKMELGLGEIDRARAIYTHASQFSDPRVDNEFWKLWTDFEVSYGNEDTFKNMLRIKRSVQAKFNTEVGYISAQLQKGSEGTNVAGFVKSKQGLNPTEFKSQEEEVIKNVDEDANPDELDV